MGLWSTAVFPCLCDLALDRPFIARHRRELLAAATGDVLEIGFGTGLNLSHYPPAVRRVVAVDPSPGMSGRARRRIRQSGMPVEQHLLGGERLPFSDHTFDTAVSTFTLCSVEDPERTLAEVYRVLRPGGQLLFLEHGLSEDAGVRKWQRRLNRLEMWLAGGCRLDRDIRQAVRVQAWAAVEVERFYLERTPRTHGSMYRGRAVK